MDIQALLGTVLSSGSTDGIGKASGVSGDQVRGILTEALPALLGGALNQSENSGTADGFAKALTQHASDNTSDVGAFLSGVDMKDGGKIVDHLLGGDEQETIDRVAKKTGAKKKDVKNVLSAVAPLLMSLLGQEVGSQQQSNNTLGVAGIMGSLLGGGAGGVTGLLGGLLGGSGSGNNSGSGIGSLLTGLLK